MLTFRQIEVFTAVMRAGSLIGAARDLRISQPTVTRMILRIEDQLGMTLFDRVKGRILPTPEATRFLAEWIALSSRCVAPLTALHWLRVLGVRSSVSVLHQASGADWCRPVWRNWPRVIRAFPCASMCSRFRRS